MKLWYFIVGLGAGAALYAAGCSGGDNTVITSAIRCHQKGMAIAAREATCNDRLIGVENLIATDPDCVAVYQGRSSGLHCIDTGLDGGGQ